MSTTGYARVSTDDQDPAAQIDALKAEGCDPIFVERASGATMQRPEWHACNRGLGKGDTLMVVRIDRLGRSLADLVSTLDDLAARGVRFCSLTEGIDTSTPIGRMVYQLAASFAEYERALIRERTCAGIDAARAAGRRIGRPPALTDEQRDLARQLHDHGEGVAAIARLLKVSPSTIRRTLLASRGSSPCHL
jgi:DNA invertase Pin-like site-specific DNA recombinase